MNTRRKSVETIAEMMQKEQAKVAKLKEQRAALDEKIHASETKIAEYEMTLNGNKYTALLSALNGKVSVDDIMTAVRNGDFLSLQEKLESGNETEPEQ